jgi:MSHA biogenesis protein MshM
MYRQHFGLEEHPFSLTPDTQFFFNSESHCQILSTVLLALRYSEGFIKIVGEVGTGKTLLSRMLLAGLGDGFQTAYIANPYLTPDELKWFLAEELGIAYSPAMPSYQLLKEINQRLISLAEQHRHVVLVVDEAQAMPRETLETLRLLTNLETEKNKLLQVVLIGQPELDELLNRPDLRQLKQRIVFSEYLQGIARNKMAEYIACRLKSAGYRGSLLFTPSAISLLYRATQGVPRLINVLAHKAMLNAYGENSETVTHLHVTSALATTQTSQAFGIVLANTKRDGVWLTLAAGVSFGAFIFFLAIALPAIINMSNRPVPTISPRVLAASPSVPTASPSVPTASSSVSTASPSIPITSPSVIAAVQENKNTALIIASLAIDKSSTDKPSTGKPSADKPSTDKSSTDKPSADKPSADKPATTEQIIKTDMIKTFVVTEAASLSVVKTKEILERDADYLSPVTIAKITAQRLAAQGDTAAAISVLEQQLSAAENNEQYRALLASLYHKTGQYQQSVLSYQRLLKNDNEKPAYWLGLALAFDGLTQHNNALQAYQHLQQFTALQLPVKTYIDKRITALRNE